MKSIHRSILARVLTTGAALLALVVMSAGGVRADIVTVQGDDGANAVDMDDDPLGLPAGDGEFRGGQRGYLFAQSGNCDCGKWRRRRPKLWQRQCRQRRRCGGDCVDGGLTWQWFVICNRDRWRRRNSAIAPISWLVLMAGPAAAPTPIAARLPVVLAAHFLPRSRLEGRAETPLVRAEEEEPAATRRRPAWQLRRTAQAPRHQVRAHLAAGAAAPMAPDQAAVLRPAALRRPAGRAALRRLQARREAAVARPSAAILASAAMVATLSPTALREADWAALYHPPRRPEGRGVREKHLEPEAKAGLRTLVAQPRPALPMLNRLQSQSVAQAVQVCRLEPS